MVRVFGQDTRRKSPARVLAVVAEDAGIGAARWFLIGPDGRVLMDGRIVEGEAESLPMAVDRTVLFAPGQAVQVRRIELAGRAAQMRASVIEQVSDELSEDSASLAIVWGQPDAAGGRLIAAIRRDVLSDWLERARRLGLEPDAILPDSLLPPVPTDHDWMALSLFGRVAVRGRDAAFTAEPDLVELVLDGGTVAAMNADGLASAAVAAALEPPLNLLEALSSRASDGWRAWRRAMILAAAVAAAPLVMIAAEAIRFELIAGNLDGRSREVVQAVWPDRAAEMAPADEVRRRLGPVLTGGFSGAAAALFSAVEAVEGTGLETLVLDGDGQIRAVIVHQDYADLQRLNDALADHGLTLNEESVLEEDSRMISDVWVTPR